MKNLTFPKTLLSIYILFFQVLFASTNLYAQTSIKDFDEYVIRTWTTDSGLPQNSINAMIQTHDGYIWLGTPMGLVRFDGVQFKNFNRLNTPALKKDMILSLYEDQNEVLWIGTDGGGLCSFKDGSWQNYSTIEGLSDDHVRVITSDRQGNLCLGTDYGLNMLTADGFQIYTTEDGLYDNIITAITQDTWGNLWVGTMRGGLAKFVDGVFQVYDYDDGLLNTSVTALTAYYLGNILIGTQDGLFTINQDEEIVFPVAMDMPITSILTDKMGSLWIGTMVDGLFQRQLDTTDNFSIDDGLPDDFIRSLLKDGDGNIWIGTDTGGLAQLKKSTIKNITTENGLPENAVTSVLQDSKGVMWVGTRNSGLAKMNQDQVIEVFNIESGLIDNRVRVLFEDNLGSLWIGTETGMNIIQNGISSIIEGLSARNITAIHQDRSKNLWIGTDEGLFIYANGKIQSIAESQGLTNQQIRVLRAGRDGSVYIGTRVGLYKFSGENFKKLNPDNQDAEFEVSSLYEDNEGVLWVGTNGNGLKRYADDKMTSFSTTGGLHDNYVFSIIEDEFNNLWMSSYNGVFQINREQLNDFAANNISYITSTSYDENDGMASRLCYGGGQPSVWKTESGKLFFPTSMGISILDPKSLQTKSQPPQVIIEDMLVDNNSVMSEKEISILAGEGSIQLQYTAFDYSAAEKIRFRHKLEGFDSNFIDSKQRIAEYQNLDSGRYRFVVKAANNDGVWSEERAVIEFKILSPFYKKPIFYVGLFLVLLFVSMGSILSQRRKISKGRQEKYKTSTLHPEKADELIPKLVSLMEDEKLYLDPDLTLIDLSKKLKIHYNHLSRIINEKFSLPYNDFVNQYRVEEAKKLLSSSDEKQSVLQIMYETGFYSKSVFNTAFKKFTGMTPTEYRKKYSKDIP